MLPEEKKSSDKLTESLKTNIGQSPMLSRSFLPFRLGWFVVLITKQGGGGGIIQPKKMLQNAKLPNIDSVPTIEVKKVLLVLLLRSSNI